MLSRHYGHEVTISEYVDLDNNPINYSLECFTCYEVIIDEEVAE